MAEPVAPIRVSQTLARSSSTKDAACVVRTAFVREWREKVLHSVSSRVMIGHHLGNG